MAYNPKFHDSLKIHRIKSAGTSWFSLPVTLEASENTYLSYPVDGVIRFAEQAVDLSIMQAIFHNLNADGSLGPPVSAPNAQFRYRV
jgi:hypothetical protein